MTPAALTLGDFLLARSTVLIVGVVAVWVAFLLLGPSIAVLWRHRRALASAARFRVTHPDEWKAAKAELKRDGEWRA